MWSSDPDTTRPFGRAATHVTCAPRGVDERSTARFDWTPAPRSVRVPGQRRRAAVARLGSQGLRNKCSNTVIAWFFAEEAFLFFENPRVGSGGMVDTTVMPT